MSHTEGFHGIGHLGIHPSGAVKPQVKALLDEAAMNVGRVRFGMYEKGPDRHFCWSGP
jgi:hypothetical protein